MKKFTLRNMLLAAAILLVLIQLVRPARTNPPTDESRTLQAKLQPSPEVNAIIERSCNDCHSNKTTWPWYSNVAPVSWFVIHHVNEGREKFSLADWASYPAPKAAKKLKEVCEQVEKGEMPMTSYLLMHSAAKLSDSDKKTLCDWAKQESAKASTGQEKKP